jgi:hypothetical protein
MTHVVLMDWNDTCGPDGMKQNSLWTDRGGPDGMI